MSSTPPSKAVQQVGRTCFWLFLFGSLLFAYHSIFHPTSLNAGICQSIYCHGKVSEPNHPSFDGYVNPVSTNPATGKCSTCHRAGKFYDSSARRTDNTEIPAISTAPAGGSHFQHASTTTYNYSCKYCHSATLENWVENSTVKMSTSAHVFNRATDIRFSTHSLTNAQTALGISSPTYGNRDAYNLAYTTAPLDITFERCANLYCHGAITTKYAVGRSTPLWGSSSDGACGTCHAVGKFAYNLSDVKQATAPVGGSHFRHASTTTYNYSCKYCHDEVLTNWVSNWTVPLSFSSHTNYATNIKFSTHNPQGKYNLATSSVISPPRDSYPTDAKCNSLYCHGRITDQYLVTMATPVWNDPSSAGCGTCHRSGQYSAAAANRTAPAGWKHSKHVSTTTYNYSCRYCHADSVNWAGVVSTATHVNNLANITFSTSSLTRGPAESAGLYKGVVSSAVPPTVSSATKFCANIYCHSNAGPLGGTTNYITVYSTDAITCTSCHKGAGTGGGTNLSASHSTHTATSKYGYTCERCHFNTVSGTSTIKTTGYDDHTNGTETVVFNPNWTGPNGAGNYAAPRCSNVYCHGNFNGSGYTTNVATWNVVSTALCGTCHGAGQYDLVRGTSPSGGSHRAHTSTTTYNYQCEYCHKITVSSTGAMIGYSTHTNYATNWSLSTNTVLIGGSAKYNNTITGSTSPPRGSNYATCTNLYCHGNGRPTAEIVYSTPTWGVSIATNCTGCHKGSKYYVNSSSTIQTGRHTAHVDNSTSSVGSNYRCKYCHNVTMANFTSDLVISSFTKHINNERSVNFSTLTWPTGSPSPNWDSPSSSCTNVYCHSNGVPKTAADYKQVKWTTGNTECYSCHGSTTTSNPAPSYTGASAGVAYTTYGSSQANTHSNHSSYNCKYCHYQTVVSSTALKSGTTIHTDGIYQVVFDTTNVGASANYDRDGTDNDILSSTDNMTCSSLVGGCHGSARWGGTLKCVECHGTTYDADNVTGTFWLDGFVSKISTNEWTYSGHGKSTNTTYDFSGSTGAGFDKGGDNGCLYCHDDNSTQHKNASNPFRLEMANVQEYETGQSSWNFVCLKCHKSSETDGYAPSGYGNKNGKDIDSAHYGTKHTTTTAGGRFCWDCHDPHGDRLNSTTGNIYMMHSTVTRISDGTFGYVSSVSTSPATRLYTLFTSTIPGTTGFYASSTTTPSFAALCNVCHISAAHYRNNFGEFHYSNDRCTKCHQHQGRFGAACNQCHAYPPSPYDSKISTAAPPAGNYLGNPYGKGKHYTNLDATTTVHLNIAIATQPANQVYATNNIECGQCHDLTNGSKHNNGIVEVGTLHTSSATFSNNNLVIFSTISYNSYAVYLSTPGGAKNDKKCVNTACHFGGRSPIWADRP